MPLKSPKQYGMMQAIAHGNSNTGIGPSKRVASELIHSTPESTRSKFAKALKKKKKYNA